MTVYFVNATANRMQALRSAGIPFEGFRLGRQAGILVDEQYRSRALLAMCVRVVDETASEYDGIRVLNVRATSRPRQQEGVIPVTTEAWDAGFVAIGGSDRFERIAAELAPFLGYQRVNLFLMDINVSRSPRPDPNKLTIFFFTAPHGRVCSECTSPTHVWNICIGERGQYKRWHPSERVPDAVTIGDGTTNVAQWVGSNLYILLPIHLTRMTTGTDVFRRVLEEVAAMRLPPNERAAFIEARTQERQMKLRAEMAARIVQVQTEGLARRDQSREAYVNACAGRFERTLNETRRDLKNTEAKSEQLQQELVQTTRYARGLRRKLEQLESVREDDRAVYAREFDKLFSVPHVIDVRTENGKIIVFTDTLNCLDPRTNKLHEIGAFRIVININGSVEWHNETRKMGNFDAPHVQNAKACLGTIEEIVPQLVGNYEYAALIMIAIQYIETVNIDDQWGRQIETWPLAA